jgi:hypothetical protein
MSDRLEVITDPSASTALDGVEKPGADTEDRHHGQDTDVKRLAELFATKVPAGSFTMAQLQVFLLCYRGFPQRALGDVERWVEISLQAEHIKKQIEESKK